MLVFTEFIFCTVTIFPIRINLKNSSNLLLELPLAALFLVLCKKTLVFIKDFPNSFPFPPHVSYLHLFPGSKGSVNESRPFGGDMINWHLPRCLLSSRRRVKYLGKTSSLNCQVS